ncbi:MAG: SDR family NAD(P)-dependent oxidoreductase [Psychrobacter sp.]|nr:SDR family NAD(P)-dependent oxidoreductase [Psychrobacter sp.]
MSVSIEDNAPHLIVIGGTSGIGLALALQHQKLGWQVSVVGRNHTKIANINLEHPNIKTYRCDLTDIAQRQRLMTELANVRFKRLIYSAGSYTNERVHTLSQADSEQMLAINLQAFQEIFSWASQQLKSQIINKDNQLAYVDKLSLICIASIAGTLYYPYASLYAKSKRAMIATASAYRCALAPFDIQVTCIASGYIDTQALRDLNNGDASHKPFIISVDKAVSQIMQAIDDDIELAVFPRPMRYIVKVLNHLPKPLLNRVLKGKLDKKT